MTLRLGGPQGKSPFYQVWQPQACGSGDIMVLICHVISEDHVIKGSYEFMVGSHKDNLLSCQV